ncbi:MAG: hypothetical protein MRY21_05705 [Simkaniaceae bacterium]|nr:hypothetical protein [Simkaniaceae bacterium]
MISSIHRPEFPRQIESYIKKKKLVVAHIEKLQKKMLIHGEDPVTKRHIRQIKKTLKLEGEKFQVLSNLALTTSHKRLGLFSSKRYGRYVYALVSVS